MVTVPLPLPPVVAVVDWLATADDVAAVEAWALVLGDAVGDPDALAEEDDVADAAEPDDDVPEYEAAAT